MKFEKSRLEALKLELGGITYPVRVTFGGMAELEELLQMPFLEIFNKIISNNFNAKEIQVTLYVMLKGGGVEVTLEDLADCDFTTDVLGIMSDALLRANMVISALDEQKEPQEDGENDKKKTQTA